MEFIRPSKLSTFAFFYSFELIVLRLSPFAEKNANGLRRILRLSPFVKYIYKFFLPNGNELFTDDGGRNLRPPSSI